MSWVEGAIDFPDEGDAPDDYSSSVREAVIRVRDDVIGALDRSSGCEIVREGFRVVICGPPNAGKSTLLNALAGREVAIVSEFAGTTRDVIEVSLDVGGLLVIVSDTAGLRESVDPVEQIGIERARSSIEASHLALWLSPTDSPAEPDGMVVCSASEFLVISTKSDLSQARDGVCSRLSVSAREGIGMDGLLSLIRDKAESLVSRSDEVLFTQVRHKKEAEQAVEALGDALGLLDSADAEIVAECLRRAARHIGAISGAVGAEDVLGEIFSRFCIGK
jgi:tRNA modification GTPase